MPNLINLIAAIAAVSAAPTTEMQYSGSLTSLDRRGDRLEVKDFQMRFLDSSDDGNRRRVLFLTSEPGGASIAWPERFGAIHNQFDPPQETGGPVQVMYRHDERPHLLTLPDPVFEHRTKLAADAAWSTDEFRYQVIGSLQLEGRSCWEVEVASTQRGGTTTVVVDPDTGRIQSGRRRLTLGQGDPFELAWRLESTRELSPEEAERTAAAADNLLALQAALGRDGDGAQPLLSPAQLETTAAAIGDLQKVAAETPFATLVTTIRRDLKNQRERAASVAELAKKFVGQSAPQFALTGLNGKPMLTDADMGKTLILHFWDYRDDPLEEPYGQIGYLDFLLNRHSGDKLAVIGVAVDRRLRDPSTSNAAVRSVRRLKSFMNLGYEIAADRDGKLLEAFGDPTRFDAALPLWVIISPDGKIAHYRTGYYEIDRELGLAEIDAIVSDLIQ